MSETTKLDYNRNPQGKGGFAERPHDISPGGWKKENSIGYQYNRFINMSTADFEAFRKLPKSERTVAQHLAYQRVVAAEKSLSDMKEITDRTEGKANQAIDITSDGAPLSITTVSFKDLA